MTNTERYFNSIKCFRKDLSDLNAKYAPEYERLERFKDSTSYASSKKSVDERREEELSALRREYNDRLKSAVDAMEKTYMEKPTSAPTQEQLSVLQTLKLRDHVSRDELKQAANNMRGCPAAERVLEEIARKNGVFLGLEQELSNDAVRRQLYSLRRSGEHLVSHLDAPNSRRAHIPRSKATWLTVLTALLGATLGAAFGGITGGVIGLSLGVLLGLYLVGLDPETWKTEMDAEDAWIVVITALLGALLGSVFLGITGGVAGFSLGAILGLYLTGFAEGDEEHGGKSQLLSELIVVLCALLGAVIGSIVTPGVGTVVGMGLGLILGLSIYSVRKDPKKGTQRLVSIGRSVLLGLLAGVLGVGLAALGIVSAGTAFIISAAIGLALKFFVDSVDDSKVRKATSSFTGTRVSTSRSTRGVAAQSLNSAAPVYNEIPALASGAVIPPNRKFLAVLGDQKSGTNVEAPLSTIKQAVMEAMAQGGREPINVNLVVDGKTLARVVVPNINNMTRAAGKPVLLY